MWAKSSVFIFSLGIPACQSLRLDHNQFSTAPARSRPMTDAGGKEVGTAVSNSGLGVSAEDEISENIVDQVQTLLKLTFAAAYFFFSFR